MSSNEAQGSEWRGTDEGSQLAGNPELWMNGNLESNPEFSSSGFDFIPGGHRIYNSGQFAGIGNTGYFWSSSHTISSADYRSIHYDHSKIWRSTITCNYGLSVRCIRDSINY